MSLSDYERCPITGGLKKKCIEWKGEIAGTAVRWALAGSVRYWIRDFTFIFTLLVTHLCPNKFFFSTDEQADLEDNSMAVQYELEEIAFENRLECSYARNPFTSIEYRASTNKDVLRRVSGKRTQLPHGQGSLRTVKGKLVYTGQWRKGKHSGSIINFDRGLENLWSSRSLP